MNWQGKPLQIWCPVGEKGEYALDREALQDILIQPAVVDSLVSIYAVAGAFRKGKSCLLNIFLKFLYADREESALRKSADTLEGFEFRGGSENCTEGIWIWDQPFFVNVGGKKVAIFLLDCQGAFDHKSSLKGVSSVFALSTLFSSVQIFNIMQQIQENDLQHLQLFSEYGQLAKQGADGMKGTQFQSLLFLVRDFHDPSKGYGFPAGNEYLQEQVLQVQSKIKEIEDVRKNIREAFEKVDCALLPFPGEKVAIRTAKDPPLTLQDFSDKFLKEVVRLVKYLFVDNITLKRVNGKPITGGDLHYFIANCCNEFESDRMPNLSSVVEASARASLAALIGKLAEDYGVIMKQKVDQGPIDQLQLQDHHRVSKQFMIEKFENTPKMGGQSLIQHYHDDLEKILESKFPLYFQINVAQKSAQEMKVSKEQMEQMQKDFQKAMKYQTDAYRELATKSSKDLEKITQEFQKAMKDQTDLYSKMLAASDAKFEKMQVQKREDHKKEMQEMTKTMATPVVKRVPQPSCIII